MSSAIPPELIELIFGFIPLHAEWRSSSLPNSTLFVCSLVSRSFCLASRRRFFSTLIIAPSATAQKTRVKLKALGKLFGERPEILVPTHTVQINLDCGTSRKWAFSNDAVLGRIFTLIKKRQRKLGHLILECRRIPDFDQAFGRRTKQAIMDLLPDLHSLTLHDVMVPSSFMERLPPLKSFHIRKLWMASQVSVSHFPPPAFADTSVVSADTISFRGVHQFYQRSQQSLPAYVNLTIDKLSSFHLNLSLNDTLSGSVRSLRKLTIQPEDLTETSYIQFDLCRFKRLTTIRVIYDIYAFHSARRILGILKIWIEFCATLLGAASSPSNLVSFEIEVHCLDHIGVMEDMDQTIEMLAAVQHIDGFHPNKLVDRHPNLESLQVEITSPSANEANERLLSPLRSTIEEFIQKLLPFAPPVPVCNFDHAFAYDILLKQLK